MKCSTKYGKRFSGYTLTELLLVLSIITVLIAVSAGAFMRIGVNLSLTEEGDKIAETLLRARQIAIANSDPVEVRFYNLTTGDDDKAVKVLQIARQEDDGHYRAENAIGLADDVAIARDPKFSSFFVDDQTTEMLLRGVAGEMYPQDPEATFVGFRFHSDGGTGLPDDKWFLTLVRTEDLDRGDGPLDPENFYTIQIDPLMGQVRVFRP